MIFMTMAASGPNIYPTNSLLLIVAACRSIVPESLNDASLNIFAALRSMASLYGAIYQLQLTTPMNGCHDGHRSLGMRAPAT